MKLKVSFVIFFLLLILFHPKLAFAQAVKADYQVEYFLDDKIRYSTVPDETRVVFRVKMTNLQSDILVKKISFTFPDSFSIKNVKAWDDYSSVIPVVSPENKKIKIDLPLSNPRVGRGTENNLYLEFYQDNLFSVNGNIWEVIIPKIEGKEKTQYKVIINLPLDTDKKITIAKPKPSYIDGKKIVWDDVDGPTIYAVFGDKQYYQTKLTYHLKNPKIFPFYTYIALPPDTLYQQIYLESLEPQPLSVSLDQDGNYLARYVLNPKESKTIIFNGVIEVFSNLREEVKAYQAKEFWEQERYLLSENKYWQLDQTDRFKNIKTPQEIYDFVKNTLKYDYQQTRSQKKRLGATQAISKSNEATCSEFTDLFIALARAKGVPAREVQGYGFSQDPILRPQFKETDILHSWPEYFDREQKLWIPVDPTWESTSGIDYFHSLDLNHIAFVIHGKEPDYPYPAGMYKIEPSKDIEIKVIKSKPVVINSLELLRPNFIKKINERDIYKTKLIFNNKSNVFLRNTLIDFKSTGLIIKPGKFIIDVIAPFEKKEFEVVYYVNAVNLKDKTNLSILSLGKTLYKDEIIIIPHGFKIIKQVVFTIFVIIVVILLASYFLLISYV